MEVHLRLLNSNLHIHALELSLKVIKYPCNTYICHVAQNSIDGDLDCMKNVWNIYSQFWPCIKFHCSLPKAKEVVHIIKRQPLTNCMVTPIIIFPSSLNRWGVIQSLFETGLSTKIKMLCIGNLPSFNTTC